MTVIRPHRTQHNNHTGEQAERLFPGVVIKNDLSRPVSPEDYGIRAKEGIQRPDADEHMRRALEPFAAEAGEIQRGQASASMISTPLYSHSFRIICPMSCFIFP